MVLRNLPCKSVWHVYVGFVVVMFLNWFFIIFPNYHFLPIYTKKGEWEKTSLIQFSDVTQQVSARVNKSRNQVMWLLNQASYCCMLLLLLLLLLRHFSRVRLCATQRRQPTRLSSLLCPWDSPGKNTGVGCHFLLQCMKVKSESEVAQSCPTLRDPMDCSLPGSSIHGIFQATVLEWGAIAFS